MAKMIWRGAWIGAHSALLIAACAVSYRFSPWGSHSDQSLMAMGLAVAVLQVHAVIALVRDALCKA